jgi:tripartite-type tricarboxylate transporter receptor subunit TctC
MIVPYPPGGPTDFVGRVVVERMKGLLRQPIIIENIGGADGTIGIGRAARARPDGYTIGLGEQSTLVFNGAFFSLQYDVLNDFTPISPLVTTYALLFARKSIPANDLKELIAWLRANPNKASAGIASSSYNLGTTLFQKETGTKFALVPYRGTAPAMQDLVGGQIDMLFNAPNQLPLVRAGSITAYAVTSERRLALAPDIPTFAEMGLPALSRTGWWGLFAPRDTPSDMGGSMPRPSRHWLIQRSDLVSSNSGMSFSHESDRHRRCSAHCRRRMPRNGGRSSRRWGSRRSEPKRAR